MMFLFVPYMIFSDMYNCVLWCQLEILNLKRSFLRSFITIEENNYPLTSFPLMWEDLKFTNSEYYIFLKKLIIISKFKKSLVIYWLQKKKKKLKISISIRYSRPWKIWQFKSEFRFFAFFFTYKVCYTSFCTTWSLSSPRVQAGGSCGYVIWPATSSPRSTSTALWYATVTTSSLLYPMTSRARTSSKVTSCTATTIVCLSHSLKRTSWFLELDRLVWYIHKVKVSKI